MFYVRMTLTCVCISAGVYAAQTKDSSTSTKITEDVLQRASVSTRFELIKQVTGIPGVIIKCVILEYDPLPAMRWIPLIDKYNSNCQYEYYRKLDLLYFSRLDFQYFSKGELGLRVSRLGLRCPGVYRIEPADEEERILAVIHQKTGVELTQTHHIVSTGLDTTHYNLNEHERKSALREPALNGLEYLLDGFMVAWVPPDSAVYRRAMNKSLLLLDEDVTLVDIGKGMTKAYSTAIKELTNYNQLPRRTLIDSYHMRQLQRYIESYKRSSMPCLLQRAEKYNGLVPVLYRVSGRNKKRKKA